MCVKFHFPSLHIYFTKIILIMIRDALSQRAVNGRLCHIHICLKSKLMPHITVLEDKMQIQYLHCYLYVAI